MVELKTDAEIAVMREAGRVVARCLAAVQAASVSGATLKQLDTVAHDLMDDAGAKPAFLDYHPRFAPSPYPGVICASVNDAVVHAIPGSYRLVEGDLVSIDCGAFLDGWCSDAAISYVVGGPDAADPADLTLIEVTERALYAGIRAARAGARLGDVGAAVAGVARPAGFGMLADHGGHGVGRAMHEQPHVPNEARRARGSDCDTVSSSPSNRCCTRAAPTPTATTPTDGPSAPPTAAAPRTSSTPSPSPRTGPASSPSCERQRSRAVSPRCPPRTPTGRDAPASACRRR